MLPVEQGLVASLARPGGNLTGISLLTIELFDKRVELISELAPEARVLALLVNPNFPGAEDSIRVVQEAARAMQALIEAGKGDVPLLELRQWHHGFRGDGEGGDGPATVIAARFLSAIVGPRGAGPKAICQALLQSHNSGLVLGSGQRGREGRGRRPAPQPREGIGERPSHAHRHRWKHAGERTYAFGR